MTEADRVLDELLSGDIREVRAQDGSLVAVLICGNDACVIQDPSDSRLVQDAVAVAGLEPSAVFVTDSATASGEACDALHEFYSIPVVGGEDSADIELDRIVADGETVFTQVREFTARYDNGILKFV